MTGFSKEDRGGGEELPQAHCRDGTDRPGNEKTEASKGPDSVKLRLDSR